MTAASATALRDRIAEDVKTAMKARDKTRLAALRLVSAEIKRVEVDERKTLSDADVIAVLNRMLKQRTESEQQFRRAVAISEGDLGVFVSRPISAALLAVAIVVLVGPRIVDRLWRRRTGGGSHGSV